MCICLSKKIIIKINCLSSVKGNEENLTCTPKGMWWKNGDKDNRKD